jgi:hypothetical protein
MHFFSSDLSAVSRMKQSAMVWWRMPLVAHAFVCGF